MTLFERRKERGFTQEYVAAAVGTDQGSISHYESGKYKPKYPTNQRLAELYGCSIDEIMEGGDADNAAKE